ncbi:MAG TPA: class I SAM-dependent methyltransferase [Terriglobales bacterium]|nr:class I SAM-dependent methyltransferase [Terriglobales bacterium]
MSALPKRRKLAAIPGELVSIDSESAIYRDGSYLKNNPSWHIEESPFKVRQIRRMLKQQNLTPKTVCDVGCGAGLVLAELQPHLPSDCVCCGYDVSPVALAMSAKRGNDNLRFRLHDIRKDECDTFFDLLLMLDVFEHVEDYMGLVRIVRSKAKQKLFHIPLDLSVQAVLRKNGLIRRRDNHAHLHYFTKETALRTLTDVGYTIVDYFYTPRCIELGDLFVQKIVRIPRQLSYAVLPDLTVRVLGGYSLMVLAE